MNRSPGHNASRQQDAQRTERTRWQSRSAARTDIGRCRSGNEDAFFRDDSLGLYIVADGMGGHAAGEIASAEAVDTIYGMVKRGLLALESVEGELTEAQTASACRIMEGAIQAATYIIFAMAELERDKIGMGTTISAALLLGCSLVTGQVGDSRIYRIRDGRAEQLTEDHTLLAWQIKQGLLTPDEAARATHRNVITRAVGNRDYVEVDTAVLVVEPGDRYLLCSDGLYGYMEPDEIAQIASLESQAAVDQFIVVANSRGGRDNITAVLVEIL
jgi:PPM family protein phosphatase